MQTEFTHIENLRDRFNLTKIGDDCAVLPKNNEKDLLISADLLVEDIDFRLKWATPFQIGHKALAVSLSDIAAMGGAPQFSMLSIGIPGTLWNSGFVEKFYEGWFDLAKSFGLELIGGDTSKTPDKVVIDSIILGEVDRGNAILRTGAKPGDSIYVSGRLGAAAAGLDILENRDLKKPLEGSELKLAEKQLQPTPHITLGKTLQANNLATAMIDLSDGLSSDLNHVCKESRVGAKIHAEKIPIDENLKFYSDSPEKNLELALHGGEDFELLFTVDPENISNKVLKDLHLIGEITEDTENIDLIANGDSKILTPNGYSHF